MHSDRRPHPMLVRPHHLEQRVQHLTEPSRHLRKLAQPLQPAQREQPQAAAERWPAHLRVQWKARERAPGRMPLGPTRSR